MLGFGIASLGPSLSHLARNVGESLDKLAILFKFKGCAYVATALLVGYFMDNFSGFAGNSRQGLLQKLVQRMESVLLLVAVVVTCLCILVMSFLKNIVWL